MTEGFLTIEHLLEYCEEWLDDKLAFNKLKRKKDAAALLGVLLFEKATDINFYFGGAINKNNAELGITEKRKEEAAEQLVEYLRNAGRMSILHSGLFNRINKQLFGVESRSGSGLRMSD